MFRSTLFQKTSMMMASSNVARNTMLQTAQSAQPMAFLRLFSSTTDNLLTGTVKWFDVKKGFGFIVPDEDASLDDDVFVHQTAIHAEGFRSLADGEPVEFTTMTDDNGRIRAANVTGPMGAYVQGTPRRTFPGNDRYNDNHDGY